MLCTAFIYKSINMDMNKIQLKRSIDFLNTSKKISFN